MPVRHTTHTHTHTHTFFTFEEVPSQVHVSVVTFILFNPLRGLRASVFVARVIDTPNKVGMLLELFVGARTYIQVQAPQAGR